MIQSNYSGVFKRHSDKLIKKAIEIAELNDSDVILDFGCEEKRLKQFCPKTCKYIGFDIKKEFADIKDWEKVDFDVIFFLNVLEHIDIKEIRRIIRKIKKRKIKLIVCYPLENLISEFGNLLLNKDKYALTYFTHINRPRDISKCLMEELGEPDKTQILNYTQLLAIWNFAKSTKTETENK